MGNIKEPTRVIPIVGTLYRPDCTVEAVLNKLTEAIGPLALHTTPQSFTHTAYYGKEMGEGLLRQWYAFDRLVDPAQLASLKIKSNEIELQYCTDKGGRSINIDPGLITLNNLILASTKNYSHRIYLGQGIYAEVTLLYRDKRFHALEWTYPDYREPASLEFFSEVRSFLKEKLVSEHGRHDV
ncbi:MAG: DUF4416 family protein [candidate division WOR-3 bacterium]|nr:MAG: DUF4416 family protein [candidate division WOR-3 bacterium]